MVTSLLMTDIDSSQQYIDISLKSQQFLTVFPTIW